MSGFNRLLKNSVANIINGFSNVILGIVISPFLLNLLSIDEFSLWNLIIQIGAFFSLVGFGIQLSVARFITLAKAKKNLGETKKTILNGLLLSIVCCVIGSVLLLFLYHYFYCFFDGVRESEVPGANIAFLVVAFSFLFGLVSSVFAGYFSGVEKNEVPALVNLLSRVILGLLVVWAARHGVETMAIVFFLTNGLSYIILYRLYAREFQSSEEISFVFGKEFQFGRFLSYCFGISIFNLAMFLIVSFNGILIGKFAFRQFAYYSLAMTLVTASIGFVNAALAPVLQPLVRLSHEGDHTKLDKVIYDLTLLMILISLGIILTATCIGPAVLSIWIGNEFAIHVESVFISLLTVNLVRLVGAPLGLLYLAQAKQNEIMYLPLLEGVLSVILTYLLVNEFGMYAVPIGLSIAVVVILFIYSFKLINIISDSKNRLMHRVVFSSYPMLMYFFVFCMENRGAGNLLSSNWGVFTFLCLSVISFLMMNRLQSLKKSLGR